MVAYIVLSAFVLGIAYNFYNARKLKYHNLIYRDLGYMVMILLGLVIFTLVAYKFSGEVLAYIIGLSGFAFMVSGILLTGIYSEGFIIYKASTLLTASIKFEDILDATYFIKDNKIYLNINTRRISFTQVFNDKYKNDILNKLDDKGIDAKLKTLSK